MFKRFLLFITVISITAFCSEENPNLNSGYRYVGGGIEYIFPTVTIGYRKRFTKFGYDISGSGLINPSKIPIAPNISGTLLWYPSQTKNVSLGIGTSALQWLVVQVGNALTEGGIHPVVATPIAANLRIGNEWQNEYGKKRYINFAAGFYYIGIQGGVGF